MKKLFLFLFIICLKATFSQIALKDADAKTIAFLENNTLYNSKTQALYNLQGQIVFLDSSNNKKDIVLTFEVLKKKTKINEGLETKPKWIIQDKTVYLRKNQEDIEFAKYLVRDGFTSFYNSSTDSLIAFLPSESISKVELVMVFYYLWNYFELEKSISYSKNNIENQNELPEGVLGYIKPVFGDPNNIWIWDGEFLFPAFDADPFFVWTFDGKLLKPLYNSRIETEWAWDGEELKPFWGGNPRNNWRWENNILRQVFDNNFKNEYEIVDRVLRKRFGSFNDLEWEIHGEVPLPIATIIILGIINR